MPITSRKVGFPKKKSRSMGKKRDDEKGVSADLFDMYLRDIRGYPPLSKEEETELAIRIQEGDEIAREKLINHNLRFVVSVAKKHLNRGLPITDLVAEGNSGLIIAADKFDPSKGIKFISYAVWWIRQSILMAIYHSKEIREPQNVAARRIKIRMFVDAYTIRYGDHPSSEQIARSFEIEVDQVEFYLTGGMLSFDDTISNQNDSKHTLHDLVPDEGETPDERISNSQEVEWILQTLNQLVETKSITPRNRKVFLIRRGFEDVDGHPVLVSYEGPTLEEIGKNMGVTRERIRQIYEKTVSRLRRALEDQMGRPEIRRLL